MKGRNPTRKEKTILTQCRLNAANWLICKEVDNGLLIKHRHTNSERVIPKEVIK